MPSGSSRRCGSARRLQSRLPCPKTPATRFLLHMPDIGATLREARMRARIDISELEAETKIRAKYLRALENEEWDLLPGPTYVKSFLREYADALGLDGKLLVAEYKLSNEGPSDFELQPITARSRARGREQKRRTAPGALRDVAVAVVVLMVIGGLILIGQVGGDDGDGGGAPPPAAPPPPEKKNNGEKKEKTQPPPPPRRPPAPPPPPPGLLRP